MPGPLKAVAAQAPQFCRYVQTAAAGTAPDGFIFTNPAGSKEYYEVVDATAVYDVVGGSGAQADVMIVPSGTALASGTSCLASVFDLTATARIPYRKALTTTAANRLVKPGDSVAIDTGGTLTGLTGLVVQVELRPVRGVRRPF